MKPTQREQLRAAGWQELRGARMAWGPRFVDPVTNRAVTVREGLRLLRERRKAHDQALAALRLEAAAAGYTDSDRYVAWLGEQIEVSKGLIPGAMRQMTKVMSGGRAFGEWMERLEEQVLELRKRG